MLVLATLDIVNGIRSIAPNLTNNLTIIQLFLNFFSPGDHGVSAGSRCLVRSEGLGPGARPRSVCSGLDQQTGLRGEGRRVPERTLRLKRLCSSEDRQTGSSSKLRAQCHSCTDCSSYCYHGYSCPLHRNSDLCSFHGYILNSKSP